MSLTSTVPAAVPLDFHNSKPWVPSLAAKNAVPLKLVKEKRFEPAEPGRMSLTSTVPAAVPLDFHSSAPVTPLSAVKNSLPLTFAMEKEKGPPEPAAPGRMSLTSTVPSAVPLDFHSSTPLVPLSAAKNSVPLMLVKEA